MVESHGEGYGEPLLCQVRLVTVHRPSFVVRLLQVNT